MQILPVKDTYQRIQVYLASWMKDRLHNSRSVLIRQLLTCATGGNCTYITIDFIQQESSHVKIHPAVGGVQEVSMQLKWREHTLPAFLFIPILMPPSFAGGFFPTSLL